MLLKEEKKSNLNTMEKSLDFKRKVKNSWKNLRNSLMFVMFTKTIFNY